MDWFPRFVRIGVECWGFGCLWIRAHFDSVLAAFGIGVGKGRGKWEIWRRRREMRRLVGWDGTFRLRVWICVLAVGMDGWGLLLILE